MSAIVVCGNNSSSSTTNNNHKRSFFEDLAISSNTNSSSSSSSSPPPSSLPKRLRRLSPSRPRPISSSCYSSHHFNPFYPSSPSALLLHLRSLFPAMDDQLLEKALEASGNDLNSAIKSLTELRLGSSNETTTSKPQLPLQSVTPSGGSVAQVDDLSAPHNLPKDGSEWVEMLVREMANSSDMDDAKARATRVLEFLETSIRSRAGTEAAHNIQMENMALKEQIEALIRENTILKRAVAIQHERQKEYDERSQELQHLKQLVSQYQEQMKTLEVNNYALTAHLKQAQQSSSIPGRFHPDVF